MLRTFAILFGAVFILIGILGFLPAFVEQGLLLGIFRVNFEHNIAHFALGILGVLAGLSSIFAARTYFFIAGAAYGFLAILGFMEKSDMLFNMIAINTADNWLHAGLAAIFLFLGFRFYR